MDIGHISYSDKVSIKTEPSMTSTVL